MEMKQTSPAPWWRGRRGEWYVVAQVALIALVLFGPRSLAGWPAWQAPFTWLAWAAGGFSLLAGAWLFASAVLRLGSNLAAVPFPKDGGSLVETGPYRLVRHPIYCGIVAMAFGWALLVHGWLTILYALAMLAFFDIKSRREERWLAERYPGYAAYRKRVRKLIPFIY
jgi:protein-S-isoprenylcysteine O-methyltransferase Ste14